MAQLPNNEQSAATRPSKQMGEAIVLALYQALRGGKIYGANNVVIKRLMQECLDTINSVYRNFGRLTLKIIRDACFLNNVRIQVSAENFSQYKSFVQELRQRCLGEIEFRGELSSPDLVNFIFILEHLDEGIEGNYLLTKKELARLEITGIDVGKLESFEDEFGYIDSEQLKQQSKEIYFSTIKVFKELMDGVQSSKALHVRKVKRLMLNAVDVMMRDGSALLGLTNIKSYDDYTFNHSVNVAIYAIALGHRLHLPKRHLNYLGIAGLFHDIGKTEVDKEVLNKPGALSPDEWEIIKTHPVHGAGIMLHQRGWGELSARVVAAAYEHHVRYNLSGYPPLSRPRKLSLFGRIITIADCYDALGRPRVYRRTPFASEKILWMLQENSGKDFDPLLVKVFINMIGIYPIGTLVLLDTDEMGVVVGTHRDPSAIDRPRICLLLQENGSYVKGEEVDLIEKKGNADAYTRSIVRALDPSEYNISIEELFL